MPRMKNPNITLRISPPQNPITPDEWQTTVDAAKALLVLDSARLYGLVTGGPEVNVKRCEEILYTGRQQGIQPRKDRVERLVGELNR